MLAWRLQLYVSILFTFALRRSAHWKRYLISVAGITTTSLLIILGGAYTWICFWVSLPENWSFQLIISLVNLNKSVVFSWFFSTFTKQILNGELHFLCSVFFVQMQYQIIVSQNIFTNNMDRSGAGTLFNR